MEIFRKSVAWCVIYSLIVSTTVLHAEAVDDEFTQISPSAKPGSGHVHGTGYGKILMRVLIFGAIPTQGVHYVPEGTDLLFAILYAGGYDDNTKLNGISIRRRTKRDIIEVNLEDIIESGEPIPKLADGDIVNVPFNWRKTYEDIIFITSIVTSFTGIILAVVALSRTGS